MFVTKVAQNGAIDSSYHEEDESRDQVRLLLKPILQDWG
jgi:hypothetical protein